MPCYDPETHEYPKRLAAKVNGLTAILCNACRVIEKTSPEIFRALPEMKVWWRNHQIIDAKIAAAKAKRARNEPLTNEESSLLYFEQG